MNSGAGFTITGVVRVVDPPLPVQVMLYVVLIVGETARDPETPDGEKPNPLQEVALVDDHESVDEPPDESVGAFGDAAATRLIPLTQGQLYVVCLKPGALKAAPIRSGERWGADARWRSFSKNFPTRRAALCFFRHDGGRTGLFVPHAAEDALLP